MDLPAAPAWTLKGTRTSFELDGKEFGPGPSYNLSGMGIKTKSVSFTTGKSQRCQINHGVLNNPSPDLYNPNYPNLQTNAITFPKDGKIKPEVTDDNPDPASYNSNFNFTKQKQPNYTMGSKYGSIMDDTGKNPGPGHYNNPETPFDSTLNTMNSKFGTQPRFSQPNSSTPGPFQYRTQNNFHPGKSSLSKSRRSLDNDNKYPGPGAYQYSDQFENNLKNNVGKRMGQKFQKGSLDINSDTTDAFNNYFRDPSKNRGKSFSVGKQSRDKVFANQQNNPGPTDYKPDPSTTFKNSNTISFPKSSAINETNQNPGPGQYATKVFNSKKYSIGRSQSVDTINKNPGVGKYNADTGMSATIYKEKYKKQSSGNLIGKSHRYNFVAKNPTGVGDYELLGYKTGGITIPRANRFPKQNANPGPGAYHMHSTLSNFNLYLKKH